MKKTFIALAISALSFSALATPSESIKEGSDKLQSEVLHQVGVFFYVADQCTEYFDENGNTEKSKALSQFKLKASNKMAPGVEELEPYKQGYESGKVLMEGEDKDDICQSMYRSVSDELEIKVEKESK